MKKLLLPLAGALLIISGLSGCQSTELQVCQRPPW